MSNLISYYESLNNSKKEGYPNFSAGDTICVHIKIIEGNKERIQKFIGIVIQRKGKGKNGETFTVMKIVDDTAVERIFPILCPSIDKIELVKKGVVRRARIYYLKELRGKSSKIKAKID